MGIRVDKEGRLWEHEILTTHYILVHNNHCFILLSSIKIFVKKIFKKKENHN